MAAGEALFSPSLIPAEVSSSLPDGFIIRPLHKADFRKGYLDCLRVLTWVGDITEEEWGKRYDEMAKATGTYYLLAIEHDDRVVGTGSLIVERKLWDTYASLLTFLYLRAPVADMFVQHPQSRTCRSRRGDCRCKRAPG